MLRSSIFAPLKGLLSSISTAVTLAVLFVALSSQSTAIAGSSLVCEDIFNFSQVPLISMQGHYRGEEQGLYYDSFFKSYWNVRYFTDVEKAPLELIPNKGLLYYRDGKPANSTYDPEFMSFENALIVLDKDHRIFITFDEMRGSIHHSSLTGGEDVIFAGTAAFHNGMLREINDNSGHYKPDTAQTLLTIRELHKMGLNLSMLRLTGRAAKEISGSISMSPKEVREYFKDLFPDP